MRLQPHSGQQLAFVLPAGPQYSGPNSGDLTLRLDAAGGQVSGTLSGAGLDYRGSYSVGFWATSAYEARTGVAALRGTGSTAAGFSGSLAAHISMSLYRSFQGGECVADDHAWTLQPSR